MRSISTPDGGVMSRTTKPLAFGSAGISKAPCSKPKKPGIPPPKRRSMFVPSCTNGGIADLKPLRLLTTEPNVG